MKRLLIVLIRLYQKYLSPDHSLWARSLQRPPYCKHIPSCSDYAIEAIDKKGLMLGTSLAVWRILRCNPWSKGGYDPVEKPIVSQSKSQIELPNIENSSLSNT